VKHISCPLSGWAVRVGEEQSLVLKIKPAFLRPKSQAEKGRELFVPGSPVAGFSKTTRILGMNGIPTRPLLRF